MHVALRFFPIHYEEESPVEAFHRGLKRDRLYRVLGSPSLHLFAHSLMDRIEHEQALFRHYIPLIEVLLAEESNQDQELARQFYLEQRQYIRTLRQWHGMMVFLEKHIDLMAFRLRAHAGHVPADPCAAVQDGLSSNLRSQTRRANGCQAGKRRTSRKHRK